MINSTVYICPVCKEPLTALQSSYTCQNKHTFDISKEGYVNFAAFTKGTSSDAGDTKQMCLDRRKFLEQGFYKQAALGICTVIKKHCNSKETKTIIDAGCGEGYYLRTIREYLANDFCYYGIDLAKEGIKLASKSEGAVQTNKIRYAVAGIFDLPFKDSSADIITSVFAPICESEFLRVLKKHGIFIVLCPSEKHLYGLKQQIYQTARQNVEKIPEYSGFSLIDTTRITYDIHVQKEYIPALFGMTPYYWKSSRQTQQAVMNLENLDTPCDFLLKVYRKD